VAFLASCREKGSLSGVETEWQCKDGAKITVRLAGRMAGPEKKPDVLEVIAEDVTELRAMEKQLRQVQKFEAIGQLAGGVAHDFNNVVGAILGWAEIGFEQARKEPKLAEHFSKIREQADRAAALTRQLLAFARQQVLQPRAIDLNSVVSNLLSFLEKVIGRDVELKVIRAPVLDLVRADPTQIEQVLMNLCLNARDAMPDGGRLLIETEVVEVDEAYCRYYSYASVGRYVVLSVSDTGMGMDAAVRERIFEPFFTTKGLGKGTGLGLATVYGIAKQHGGFIHVYSEPGQGSLFRVYVPAISAAASPVEEKLVAAPVASPVPKGTETILLVEDHDGIREMALQTLASLGYRVLAATNGEEAMRICENERPAIAILDVVMPKMNGPATYQNLQARFPGLPVIFTTGYTAEQAALEKHLQGGGTVLQKPYSPTLLARMVREQLDRVALAAKPRD
jgi:signal transduction histidine kinase/CheY-like chemotaxis protein